MAQSRALQAHLDAENAHDVDAVVATFAEDAVLILNGEVFRGRDLIRRVHRRFGFGDDGAFSELTVREVERHVGERAVVIRDGGRAWIRPGGYSRYRSARYTSSTPQVCCRPNGCTSTAPRS